MFALGPGGTAVFAFTATMIARDVIRGMFARLARGRHGIALRRSARVAARFE